MTAETPKTAGVIDRALALRIRQRRIMQGLTQQQMAERIGVTYQQAHKYGIRPNCSQGSSPRLGRSGKRRRTAGCCNWPQRSPNSARASRLRCSAWCG